MYAHSFNVSANLTCHYARASRSRTFQPSSFANNGATTAVDLKRKAQIGFMAAQCRSNFSRGHEIIGHTAAGRAQAKVLAQRFGLTEEADYQKVLTALM